MYKLRMNEFCIISIIKSWDVMFVLLQCIMFLRIQLQKVKSKWNKKTK
jgi:hypothetical protein